MRPTWLFLMFLGDFLLGAAIGWMACRRRSSRHPVVDSHRPQAPVQEGDSDCERLLEEVQEQLSSHSGLLREFESWLASTAGEAAGNTTVDINQRITTMRQANERVEETLGKKLKGLSGVIGRYRETLQEELHRLWRYRKKTAQLNCQLVRFQTTEGLDSLIQQLLAAVVELRDDNEELRQDLATCQHQLIKQIARREAAEEEARIDPLTRLPNRRAFEEKIAEFQSLYQRYEQEYVLILFDLDRFKSLNDRYGHAAGDAVLAMVGRLFTDMRRGSDHVSRFGGEEFALLLPNCSASQAETLAERYRSRLEAASVRYAGDELRVTTSAGIAEVAPGETTRSLVTRSDTALYAAKRMGRNRVHVSEPSHEPQLMT